MAKRKAATQAKPTAKQPARPKTPAQEALEVTWVLKGHLKNTQVSYMRVGSLLAQVRDKGLFKALHHETLESYAEERERLSLGPSSLYKYLRVHDWVMASHPEWAETCHARWDRADKPLIGDS